jgi:hypothetical protein
MAGQVMSAGTTFWQVTFAHDHATIQTTVAARNDEEATDTARTFILDHYGIDLSHWWIADAEDSGMPA